MKWFDRWFARKCKWAWEHKDAIGQDVEVPLTLQSQIIEEGVAWGDGLRINVKKIIGGSVVSFRTYDRTKDRTDERHYIITDEQEFDRELGKIITLESMRQS